MAQGEGSMGQEAKGRVERIVAGGLALLRHEGSVCFVPGALEGELLRYEITGKQRGVLKGRVLEILEASEHRVTPPCVYYESCGGCDLQEIAYEEQLRVKRTILTEQLTRLGGLSDPPVREVRHRGSYGYRTRVRMRRSAEGGFGFRKRSSREVVPVSRCIVASDRINRALRELEVSGEELLLTESDEGVILHAVDGSGEPPVARVTLLSKEVYFSAAGFFQGNLELFGDLLREMAELAEPAAPYTLYDLYAGSGVISSVLSSCLDPAPEAVECVESDSRSAALLEENLRSADARIHREPLEGYIGKAEPPPRGSIVVVDPPRAGLTREVRRWLLLGEPAQLFYVSCDPSTLARDLGHLKTRYTVAEVRPFDFFPQTSHIETMSLLLPREPGA